MSYPVFRGAGYVLVHTPDMIIKNGTTCTVEQEINPDSEFLKEVGSKIRSYEEVVNYLPNQVYIGNERPEALADLKLPWCEIEHKGERRGKFGQIVPQDEFLALMQISDAFELVKLSRSEEHTSELQSRQYLVCRLLLEKKKKKSIA